MEIGSKESLSTAKNMVREQKSFQMVRYTSVITGKAFQMVLENICGMIKALTRAPLRMESDKVMELGSNNWKRKSTVKSSFKTMSLKETLWMIKNMVMECLLGPLDQPMKAISWMIWGMVLEWWNGRCVGQFMKENGTKENSMEEVGSKQQMASYRKVFSKKTYS